MTSRIRAYAWLTRTSSRLLIERARGGPRDPSWGWRYELLIGLMRARVEATRGQPVEKARRGLDRLGQYAPGLTAWEEVDAGGVPAAWARPKDAEEGAILYMHGGGYNIGSVRSHRGLIERLASLSRRPTLGIDYRLAPEHPCPAAIEDAVAAYRWLLAQGHSPQEIAFAGDSAGGGLTLASLMALRDAGGPLPAAGVCLSPWIDLTLAGASHETNGHLDYLAVGDKPGYAARYAGALPLDDPRVSPLFGDPRGLPPLLIQAGGAEVLLDDAVRYAAKAQAAGADVTLDVWPGQVHVWHGLARFVPAGQQALAQAADFIRRHTGG